MLTYQAPNTAKKHTAHPSRHSIISQGFVLILLFVWLWPGVLAHDLWTSAEWLFFASVNQSRSFSPFFTLFGESAWNVAPLSAYLAQLTSRVAPMHLFNHYEALRLSSLLLALVGIVASAAAARIFYPKKVYHLTVLWLLGAIGLLIPAHLMGSVIVLFSGMALSLYGMALSQKRLIAAVFVSVAGWLTLALSGSLLWMIAAMLSGALIMTSKAWRTRRYALVFGLSLMFTLIHLFAWQFVLFRASNTLWQTWWNTRALYPLGGFGGLHFAFSLPYYAKNLLWFAFPAWLPALWILIKKRKESTHWQSAVMSQLLVVSLILSIIPHTFQDYLLLVLPALALAATIASERLPSDAAAFLNWLARGMFGLLTLFLWLGFFAMNYGWPLKLANRSLYFSPYYQAHISVVGVSIAVFFSLFWLKKMLAKLRHSEEAFTNWALGVVLTWSLLLTLFLPWLDAAKSYRPVVERLVERLEKVVDKTNICVNVHPKHLSARVALNEYARPDIAARFHVNDTACTLQLASVPKSALSDASTRPATRGWTTIWQGSRPRETNDIWLLQERSNFD